MIMNTLQRPMARRPDLVGPAALILVLFIFSTPAQQNNVTLRGQLTDQLGGAVVGATVTIINAANEEKTSISNGEGNYSFTGLTPGTYRFRVAAPGFLVHEDAAVVVVPGRRSLLDIQLSVTFEKQEEVTVAAQAGLSTDSDQNADAVVLRGKDLDALPDDPDSLAASLQAIAGPSAGGGGGQVFVDGFTGGRLPPKESIREIRVGQNPLNAEYDRPGFGRIDILTKPGTDKLRGSASFNFSDEALNSRNPFARERAPYQSKLYGGSLSGTIIPKKASFFVDFQKRDVNENGIVNARILDAALNVTQFPVTVLVPTKFTTFSPRFDYQFGANHTVIARYTYTKSSLLNQGVGELSLPERAFDSLSRQHTFQITETAILNANVINETRFQFVKERREQEGDGLTPSLVVQDAFLGGGSGIGLAINNSDRYELQNYTTSTLGRHVLRFGMRVRGVRITDVGTANFNGTFIFAGGEGITSLERYRRTLLLQRQGFSPSEIRAQGGGATQFSIAGGDPEARISQTDFGAFVQDEWRLRPNFTLTLGVRYETQTNIRSRFNFAPRVFFAWAPGGTSVGTWGNGPPAGGPSQPMLVIRGGFGMFYDRFNESNTLQAIRFDGTRQLRFNVTEPTVLDLFPDVPPVDALQEFALQQTTSRVAQDFQAPYSVHYILSVERQLPRKFSVFLFAFNYRTLHALRLRNVNAPLPGTYVPGESPSGVRPFGNVGEIYQYESSAKLNLNQLAVGTRSQLNPAFSIFATYVLSKAESDADFSPFGGFGSGSFPANSYDLSGEYGRAAFDVRHRLFMGGTINIPKLKLTLNPFIMAFSGRPFNITTGRDTNGDRLFTERPAFATANTSPADLRRTPFGDFDVNPAPGSQIIPRNFGRGPDFFAVNVGLSRTFAFGDVPSPPPVASAAPPAATTPQPGGARTTAGSPGGSSSGGPAQAEKRYKVTVSINVQNLLNRTNLVTPIGNLSSPLFSQSVRTLGAFDFGGGGSTTSAANRRVEAQIRFNF